MPGPPPLTFSAMNLGKTGRGDTPSQCSPPPNMNPSSTPKSNRSAGQYIPPRARWETNLLNTCLAAQIMV